MRQLNDREAPVKVDDILDVKIEAIGEKGDGLCRREKYVIFVPNTQIDDEVKVKVTRVLPKFAFAEVVNDEQEEE